LDAVLVAYAPSAMELEKPPVEVPGPRRIEKSSVSVVLSTVSLNPAFRPIKIELEAGIKENTSKEEAKLAGARFRALNQHLYEISGDDAVAYFHRDPNEFRHYHLGFRAQTKAWPANPVDLFISKMRTSVFDHPNVGLKISDDTVRSDDSLVEEKSYELKDPCGIQKSKKIKANKKTVIADIGCGEAKIAKDLCSLSDDFEVHSFDLVAVNKYVNVANMSDIPLADNSVDFAVFSLALMNTDYGLALMEAFRILRPGTGNLWIAEVSSRFEGSLLEDFKVSLKSLGFKVNSVDRSNTHFFIINAVKTRSLPSYSPKTKTTIMFPELRPCLYKKR
jgi:ribosomal RNA-processing protein 8